MNNPSTDFDITLKEIKYLSPRVSYGIEIIFVINGEITVETDSRIYVLKEKDVLVINRNELYQIIGKSNNTVLLLTISDFYIDQFYDEYRKSRFECFSQEVDIGREELLNNIRKLMIQLMISYSRKEESYRIEIQSYLCDILLNLIRGFKKKGGVYEQLDTDDYRLAQMIEYLEKNYYQAITLEEMAKKFYLSSAYLSRYFKQKMGMGFSRYLMNIRLVVSLSGYTFCLIIGHFIWKRMDLITTFVFTGGMRNIAVGVVVASTYFPPKVVLPVVFGMLFQQVLASQFSKVLEKYQEKFFPKVELES